LEKRILVASIAALTGGIASSLIAPPEIRALPLLLSLLLVVSRILISKLKKKIVVYEVDDTLVYLITHMYAISTGKPPKKRLFELQTIAGGYGEYDAILKRIAVLAVDWGYGFARAIRAVIRNVRNKVFRDFLLRLGELLNIGEDPEMFLDIERRALLTEFQAHYGRIIEASKMLLGVYTSGVSSAIFLVVTFMIFTFLFSMPPASLLFVFIGVGTALSALIYVLYRMLPRDRLTHTLNVYPKERIRYRILLIIGIVLSIITGIIAYTALGKIHLAMSIGALPLLIPGFYARRIEKKIREIESFFPIFIRSFGLTYATVPHVPTALSSVLRSEYGPLTKYLKELLARFNMDINPKVSWYRFIGDTWSEMIRRNVNVLYDAIDVHGDLAKVGTVLSETTFRILDARKQRVQVAKAFESTIYIVHTLFSAILSFMLTLLGIFHSIISSMQSMQTEVAGILPFNPPPIGIMAVMAPIFVLVLAILNAIAIKVVQGGMYETVWVPIAILICISGVVLFGVETLTQSLFSQLMGFEKLVKM